MTVFQIDFIIICIDRILKCYYSNDKYLYKFIRLLSNGDNSLFTLVTNKGEHSIIYSQKRNIETIERVRKIVKHRERRKIAKSETPSYTI